jgi:hypothetical protein
MGGNEPQTMAAPAPPKRRWLPRLRFSLRTMLLASAGMFAAG